MAVTGAIFNSLVFGGVNSADYGIYITGEAVFNAPKRAVETVSVPGRNGDIIIDQGHWENIEVTYPAGTFGMDETEFRTALSDFRNAIVSQLGYQRLSDTYHPDEYRMGTYVEGLEVDAKNSNKAGQFNLVFNCKPQRWLTSGETAVTIGEWGETETVSGGIVEIDNPNGIKSVKSLKISLEPIQAGSGTPSPNNVRPISGRTEVVTYRTDEQLYIPSNTEIGKNWIMNNASDRAINVFAVQPNTKYKVYTSGGNFTDALFIEMNNSSQVKSTAIRSPYNDYITTSSNTNKIIIQWSSSGTMTASNFIGYQCSVSKELSTYTTSLGRTVYGGTLDVVSGVLTVDRVMATFDGTEYWGSTSGFVNRFRATVSANASNANQISNYLTKTDWGVTPYTFSVRDTYLYVSLDTNASQITVDEFEAYLSAQPLQVCYELANPQTIQLTPQQIDLLLGTNNVWSDGAVSVEYGQDPSILYNPTQYDAGPLLIVEGYGDIRFNGYQIELKNEVYGEIVVVPAEQKILAGQNVSKSFYLDPVLYRDGDPIETSIRIGWQVKSNESGLTFSSFDSVTYAGYQCYTTKLKHSNYLFATSTFFVSLVAGTSKSLATTATATYKYTLNSATVTETVTIELSVVYDATSDTLAFNVVGANSEKTYSMASEYVTTDMIANSTEDVLGEPTYINCEIGEAYKIEHDRPVSLNRYVDLGSDLPKFTKGDNQVTFNSTMITDLKIAPNWWKL